MWAAPEQDHRSRQVRIHSLLADPILNQSVDGAKTSTRNFNVLGDRSQRYVEPNKHNYGFKAARELHTRHSNTSASPQNPVTMQSLLAPAAQGRLKVWETSMDEATTPSGDTAVYNDRYETEHHVMESLCLRRDLSRPESPPFGVWWTYTIEETLLWPILTFGGSINRSLDVTMLAANDDVESGYEDNDLSEAENDVEIPDKQGQTEPTLAQDTLISDRRGLDDGTIVPRLIASFLENVHAKCPILHHRTLQSQANDLVENGLGWDAGTCKVLLACALGAISSSWNRHNLSDHAGQSSLSERLTLAKDYFLAAQKRLGRLYTSSSLEAAQCLFLAGTYCMYSLQPVAGWRLLNATSVACRAYISKKAARRNLGLRQGGSQSLDTRLYWSCFMAEREVACEFGMETHGLNIIAHSTSLPTPPNVYSSAMSERQPPLSTHIIEDDRSWYFFLTHIMLRKLEMRIDEYTQAKQQEAYRRAGDTPEVFYQSLYEANAEFDYQLTCYYESLPATIQFSLYDLIPCADELCQYLKWRVTSVRHDICMPALYALINYDVACWSEELVNGLITHANTLLRSEIVFLWAAASTHRDSNTWLALRKGVRAGLILVAARRLKAQNRPGLMALQVPDDQTCWRAAQALVQGLKYWAPESKDCANNLDMLRNLHPDFRD